MVFDTKEKIKMNLGSQITLKCDCGISNKGEFILRELCIITISEGNLSKVLLRKF